MPQMPPRMDYVQYDMAYPRVFAHLTRTIHSLLPALVPSRWQHVGARPSIERRRTTGRWGLPVRMGQLVCKVAGMPGPKPPQIELTGDERSELEKLVRAERTGQALARRARVVLLAAMG